MTRNELVAVLLNLKTKREDTTFGRRPFSMDSFMGPAAVFFTITPPDVRTLAISVTSGVLSVARAMSLNVTDIPSHTERVAIAGCNPAACSEYFDTVCSAFFDPIVCVDRNTGFSRPEGGLVGVCKGYIGVVES